MVSREIDAKVAEHVMGRETHWESADYFFKRTSLIPAQRVPHYSTDIKAAWEVFNKLGAGEGMCRKHVERLDGPLTSEWRCCIAAEDWTVWESAHTAEMAICRAALKAAGIEIGK